MAAWRRRNGSKNAENNIAARRLSDRYGPTVGARTLDILHVAAAVVLGANKFLSLDQRQRALAKKAGLTVEP